MLVNTGQGFCDGRIEVLCSSCASVVGVFYLYEVGEMVKVGEGGIYCFECDNVGADSVSPCLVGGLTISDNVIWVDGKGVRHLERKYLFKDGHVSKEVVSKIVV
jgi:hypothetical protein